jgi:integral membrane sensor domain MASE1
MAKTGAMPHFTQIAWVVLFALTYFGAGILGIFFYFDPEHVATFWPASGVFLAGLLLSRFGLWPVLVLAAIAAHVGFDMLVSGKAVGTSLFFSSADVVEACTGAFLLRRVLGMSGTLSQLKEVLGLAVVAGICSTALGAAVGAAAVVTVFPKARGLAGENGDMARGAAWSPFGGFRSPGLTSEKSPALQCRCPYQN